MSEQTIPSVPVPVNLLAVMVQIIDRGAQQNIFEEDELPTVSVVREAFAELVAPFLAEEESEQAE